MSCLSCNDKGTPNGCPVCGKTTQIKKIVPDFKVNEEMLSIIPERYRDVWNSDIIREKFMEYQNDPQLDVYLRKLDELVEVFQKGMLPKNSSIIMSTIGLGKTRLAYYCMALALEHGYTVAPLFDNTEYRRLNMLSTDNQLYKEFLKNNKHLPTIEKIVQADVCFMTIDPCNYKEAYQDIMSLLSKRDRLGKTTIILSCFTVNQITYSDYTHMFLRLVTNNLTTSTKTLKRLELFLGV